MNKPNIEKEIEHKVYEPELTYKFFTKEGVILLGLAIVFIATQNVYLKYLAWPLLVAAFLVPMLKTYLKGKKH